MGKNKKQIASLILLFLVLMVLGGCSSSKTDVAHDPNGFLGYSDSFWEWYQKNN